MSSSRRTFLTILLALACAPGRAFATETRIGIVFHIARSKGTSVASDAFVDEQLSHARAIFKPLGIALVDGGREPLAARHAELVTRADRDALAPYVRKGAVHCMVVAQLMDVDEPGRVRRGVHWHERGRAARHFVIVSAISGPDVLAHELGHYFGNPEHSDTPGNLMSYTRGDVPPFLDEAQIARVHAALARMLTRGELVAHERSEPVRM